MSTRVLVMTCILAMCTWRANTQVWPSVRSVALASSGYTIEGHDALYTNQAGLVDGDGIGWSAGALQLHGIGDLYHFNGGVSMADPGYGAFGLRLRRYGNDTYRETGATFCYARRIGNGLSAAVAFRYRQRAVTNYRIDARLSFQLGLLTSLGEGLSLGFHLGHPLKINPDAAAVSPNELALELGYRPITDLRVTAGIQKDILYPPSVTVALEYQWYPFLTLYTGVRTDPVSLHLGTGWNVGQYRVDLAVSNHLYLGLTPGIGISSR